MSDQVEFGRRRHWGYHSISEEEILASNPEQPVFEDEITDVAGRVTFGLYRHCTGTSDPEGEADLNSAKAGITT